MDDLDNYVPSGWKRDLLHIVGCHYAHQIGPLADEKWEKDSQVFLQAMKLCKEKEWLAIKELEPVDYMSYVAAMFKQVTGHYLKGLSGYTGWMRTSGYYHWKVAELSQLDRCPNLRGIPVPKGPIAQPSTRQQPPKPQQVQRWHRLMNQRCRPVLLEVIEVSSYPPQWNLMIIFRKRPELVTLQAGITGQSRRRSGGRPTRS